jgi:glucose-1-phosphatase
MIKTLIFDLGNVIVAFDHRKISERLAPICDHSSDVIFSRAVAGAFVQEYGLGRISTPEFLAIVRRELDLQISDEDFYDAWNCTFRPEPIIAESLIEILSKKYKLLILSDTNEMHFGFLRKNFPILKYFDDFIVSHQVGVAKPSAEIFRKAVERAACRPDECLFIDDAPANVEGAKKIGMNAWRFSSVEQLTAELSAHDLL